MLEFMGIRAKRGKLSFPEITKRFLNENKHWLKITYPLNKYILRLKIVGKPFPANPTALLKVIIQIHRIVIVLINLMLISFLCILKSTQPPTYKKPRVTGA